jgi:hypothetical protein
MTMLRRRQIGFGTSPLLHLQGKGQKDRTVPLWSQTSRV